jgi:hypothetical protein
VLIQLFLRSPPLKAMTSIFINYRRDDTSGYSGRIHERLASTFGSGSVFMDLDDIRPGFDFVRAIDESLAKCDAMIVLIGKRWLEARDASGRKRIDSPEDFVHLEIAKALQRNIRVIPVLVNNAAMPSAKDLPASLAQLANLQAMELSDERWDYDLGQLIGAIRGATPGVSERRKLWVGLAAAAVVLLGAASASMWWRAAPPPPAIAGEWVADIEYDFGGPYAERFVFRVNGENLAGIASFLAFDRSILEGKITNNEIAFMTRTEEIQGEERRQAEHHYKGTFADDEIRLVIQTEGGFSVHPPVEATARRKTAPPLR